MPKKRSAKKSKPKAGGLEDGIDLEECRRQIASVLDKDGQLAYNGSDPTCRKYCSLYESAKRYHLQDLERVIPEVVSALHANDPNSLAASYMTLYNLAGPPQNHSPQEYRQKIETHCDWLEKVIGAFSDRNLASALSRKNDKICSWLITVLGPQGQFDVGHNLHQMQNTMTSGFQGKDGKDGKQRQKFMDFEAENPIEKYQRNKQEGYTEAVRHAAQLTNAETANEYGKKAWVKSKKWTAELYWEKATELAPGEAKYFSNLAHVRVHLGRYLRSIEVGYRNLATRMLEQAVNDAKMSAELDPQFERAYQRWAEALLALGPYDRAMEACRVLSRGMEQETGNSSSVLVQLLQTAKTNARRWLPVASLAPTTIPATLHAALANLRSAVVACLAVEQLTDEEIRNGADSITDAAWAVRGALELVYLRRDQWELEKQAASGDDQVSDVTEVEKQLRQISKAIPLRAVALNDSLKQLAFMEGPWTLWGLDRVDRSGVPGLSCDVKDPCENDQETDHGFQEVLQRKTGGTALDLSSIMGVMDVINGKGPTSYARDMTPPNFAALGFSLLQRMILAKDCPFQKAASQRVITLYFSPNGNGLWAGGEFLGMCMNCAAGVGKYGVPADEARSAEFMRLPRGVAAMATEVSQSQDNHGYYQKALARLSPQDWSTLKANDFVLVLRNYILAGMDEACYLKPAEIAPYVIKILSAMLDGTPDTVRMFLTGECASASEFDGVNLTNYHAIFYAMEESAFGIFVNRRFMDCERDLKDQGHVAPSTKQVMSLVVQKWLKLPKDKRSAYRWESLDDKVKDGLSHMAPVDKVDRVRKKEQTKENPETKEKLDMMPIVKAPQCANCGEKEGCGVELLRCPCRLVRYCTKECQNSDFPNHKKACRQQRSGKA
jgi:tetratricopeptide (TPR) repeat protein